VADRRIGVFLVLWLGLLLELFLPTIARSHHVVGMAHFNYDENSLRPALRLAQTVGSWELSVACYPGDPAPGEETELLVSIRDLSSNTQYSETIGCTIRQVSFLRENQIVFGPEVTSVDGGQFSFRPTFPADGNYEVTICFQDGDLISTLMLPVVAGEPGAPWAILGGFGVGCVLFVAVICVIRAARSRRSLRLVAS